MRTDAQRFALAFLRTDPPGDAREDVGCIQDGGRPRKVAVADGLHEARNVHADRAAADALGRLAAEAPLRFGAGRVDGHPQIHFHEVARASVRILLGHLLTWYAQSFGGFQGHGSPAVSIDPRHNQRWRRAVVPGLCGISPLTIKRICRVSRNAHGLSPSAKVCASGGGAQRLSLRMQPAGVSRFSLLEALVA